MNRTAFVIYGREGIKETLIVNNHSLEIQGSESTRFSWSPVTTTLQNRKPTHSRTIHIQTEKLGKTTITVLAMPLERDKLNAMTISEAHTWMWTPAVGALMAEGDFIWRDDLVPSFGVAALDLSPASLPLAVADPTSTTVSIPCW